MKFQFKEKLIFITVVLCLIMVTGIHAESEAPENWGIGMGLRVADIPFEAESDTVNDIIPLFFYDNGRFFIDGLETGYRVLKRDDWQLSPIARFRFFDIPEEYQNEVREDGLDFGLQYTYQFSETFYTDFEVLSDSNGYVHANVVPTLEYEFGDWDIKPYGRLRWKSSDFNNHYWGLEVENPGSAFDFMLGTDFRYHVWSNLYLIGQGRILLIDSDTRDVSFVDSSTKFEAFLGIGFFDDKNNPSARTLDAKPYFRLAHGWATPSSLADITSFNTEKDPYNNQMTSFFFGVPLADKLFTLPIETYLTPGLVLHHSSEVQSSSNEYVLAVKFYYTVKWPIDWRLGFAEGLSYADGIPYVEQTSMDEKGYRASELLNYLDFSIDFSLGQLFRAESIGDLWLGYSIHHRSGIFSSSSAFGRISGGSNYNTIYLQYHW